MIGGTDVEAPKPLFEIVTDTGKGEVVHDRTKKVSMPKFPFSCDYAKPTARCLPAPGSIGMVNFEGQPLFRKELCKPALGLFTGAGIIEPLDDLRREPAHQSRAARLT